LPPLYTLDSSSFITCIFCKYFLPDCGYLFISLESVICRAEVFNYNEVNLSVIFFIDHAFGRKIPPYPRLFVFLLCYLLGVLEFCVLYSGLWIHFELIFIKSVRSVSRLILLLVDVKLFQHYSLKNDLSSIVLPLFFYFYFFWSKISWLHLCGSTSGFSVLFHWSICLFLHQYHTSWLLSFIVSLAVRYCQSFNYILSFNIVLAVLGFLPLNILFRISLSTSTQ